MRDATGPATPHARSAGGVPRPVTIWDLPTRLFHWSAVLLVTCSVVTAKVGGNWMEWHARCGYAILAVVLFRILWGFAGPRYARFAQFVRGPRDVLAYLRDTRAGTAVGHAGHNPLGALSVLALLAALLLQASTGLFASDEIAMEGPLAKLASGTWVERASFIHEVNEKVIYALVGLHLAAIAFYAVVKRERLVPAMVTGRKTTAAEPTEDDRAVRIRALIMAGLAVALVTFVVTL
jgi:cytochrome b